MKSPTTTQGSTDLTGRAAHPVLALILALLSVPGSTLAWDVWEGGGGFVIGLPLGLAAITLGAQARHRTPGGRGKATAAIVIAALMLVMMAVWTIVESL